MEQSDIDPYVVRDLLQVSQACTRWLEARGLTTMTLKERIGAQLANRERWKELRRARKAYNAECQVWETED